jgi:hypothetical protein
MNRYRLVGLTAIAVLVAALATASTTLAAIPTFKPSTKNVISVTSGTGTLEVAGSGSESITCASDSGSGLLEPGGVTKDVLITFSSCVGKSSSGTTCKAMSLGGSSEAITTAGLSGELGEVAASEAKTTAGEYFAPESGKVFTTVLGSCIVETQVRGSIAGEVTPTLKSQTTGEVILSGAKGVMSIKKITTKAGGQTPSLTAFGSAVGSENTKEAITFKSGAVEVS